jgi:hypothetical protein
MRNYSDQKMVQTTGVELRDLFQHAPSVPVVHRQAMADARPIRASGPPPVNVEIFRDGKTAESVSFINTGLRRTVRRAPSRSRGEAPGATSASAVPAPPVPPDVSPPPPSPDHASATGTDPSPPAASAGASATGALPVIATAPFAQAAAAGDSADAVQPYQPAPKTLYIP